MDVVEGSPAAVRRTETDRQHPPSSIRIEEESNRAAAERAGKTAHAFIVDAIAQTVEQAEIDAEFHRLADERWGGVLTTGKTVDWQYAKACLEARARGGKPRKPAARGFNQR